MSRRSSSAKGRKRGESSDADALFVVDDVVGSGVGPRVLRIERLLFEELDRLFRLEVSDPRLQEVSVARVELSPDLRNAKVYYAVRTDLISLPASPAGPPATKVHPRVAAHNQKKAIDEGIARVTPFLRARLAGVLSMKRLPDLHFHRDRMAESSVRATELLTQNPVAARAVASLAQAGEGAADDDATDRDEAVPRAPSAAVGASDACA